jgi:hypothetical protein
MTLLDEIRAFISFTRQDKVFNPKEANRLWRGIFLQITDKFHVLEEIEGVINETNTSRSVRICEFCRRFVNKSLKRYITSLEQEIDDAALVKGIAHCIRVTLNTCRQKLSAYMKQDELLMQLIERNENVLDEISGFFELRNYARWANPNAKDGQMEAEVFIEKCVLKEAILAFSRQTENDSPSSFIANYLFKDATAKRRKELDYLTHEDIIDIHMTAAKPAVSTSKISAMLQEGFGFTSTEFFLLLRKAAENQMRTASKPFDINPMAILRELLRYRCGDDFPLEQRVLAVYLRDAKGYSCSRICEILRAEPYKLESLNERKLSDILDKFRRKIRSRLEASLKSKEAAK